MRRASILLLPFAVACGFRSPDGSGGSDGPPGPDVDAAGPQCDLGVTWEQGKQPTKTVHVAKTPVAGTPDGSAEKPFPSLSAASSAIEPGVRIVIGPGDYAGATLTDKRGTADAPIWLEGPSSGPPARILGGAGPGIHLVSAQYWVIRNLKIENLTDFPGINVDDVSGPGSAHHIVIDRVTVASTPRPCLQLSGVTDVTIRDATLGSCDRGVMMVGVQRAVIGRTQISSMTTAGVALAGGSAGIEVRQNVISSVTGRAVWIGGDSDENEFRPPLSAATGNTEARDIRVFDNVITDVEIAIACSNCGSSLVAHNLLRDVDDTVLALYQPYTTINGHMFAAAGGVTLVNNAIEGDSDTRAFYTPDSGTAPASCSFAHNMWHRNGGGGTWMPTLPATETRGIYSQQSGYGDDGRLCAGASPAAGAAISLPEVPGTLQGQCRAMPPSIGPGEPAFGC